MQNSGDESHGFLKAMTLHWKRQQSVTIKQSLLKSRQNKNQLLTEVFNLKKSIFHGILIGLAGGAIASLCCLGPIILASLGIAAVFGLAGVCLLDLRSLFFSIGLVFVAIAGFLYFRTKNKTCKASKTGKGSKICGLSSKHKLAFVLFAILAMSLIYLALMWVVVPQFLSTGEGLACSLPIQQN